MSEDEVDNQIEHVDKEITDITYRKNFTLPRKIKLVKTIIAVVVNFLLGGVMIVFSIYYFSTSAIEKTNYLTAFAILLLLFGGILFLQFPFLMVRTLNSQLILGQKVISVRNFLAWKRIPWNDIQDILLRQKFSKHMDSNELINIDLIRFRTITQGIHFLAEIYPVIDVEEMLESIKDSFVAAIAETDYKIIEKSERPSAEIRLLYYEKVMK